MDRHRKILGWSFFLLGGMNAIGMTVMTLNNFEVFSGQAWEIYLMNLVVISICSASSVGGFFILKKKRWAFKMLFKLAFVWLVFFPLGTALALYYFYFNFMHLRKADI